MGETSSSSDFSNSVCKKNKIVSTVEEIHTEKNIKDQASNFFLRILIISQKQVTQKFGVSRLISFQI